MLSKTDKICCCSLVAKPCPNLCDPMNCNMPGSLSSTISQSLLKIISIELVMLSNHLILCYALLLPSSFLESGYFPVSLLFTSGDQSIGISASASILPMNIQG